ncbi:MAG: response regulator [Mariprofundaceae bacterium]
MNFDHHHYPLRADADVLQQSMINLIQNAYEATSDLQEGNIKLGLFDSSKNTKLLNIHPSLADQSFAHMVIQDNGRGIEPKNITRIYDPFFTTKQLGNGLGLAQVSGCISQHHGFIEIESEPGDTKVHLLLPLHSVDSIPHASADVDNDFFATVLVVDDDIAILEVCEELLNDLGHQVMTAPNGEEACKLFKQHMDEIDVILMDILMPRMSGIGAAKEIRKIKSDVPIIFATSYDKNIAMHEVDKMSHCTLISKPFDPDYLQELLIKFVKKS